MRSFAVCSDTKVGKGNAEEDIHTCDLAIPPTTDVQKLARKLQAGSRPGVIDVVFATYQSLEVVEQAQEHGAPPFSIAIADEAHRTTGVEKALFTRIHDKDRLRAEKRLFMTATPRIYTDAAKTKVRKADKGYYSMDEAHYGEEFYRLNFGEAVEQQLLSDYKVLILCASEQHVSRQMQGMLADDTGEIQVDDAAKILGCWDALTNPGREAVGPLRGQDSAPGKPPPSQVKPLKRAVAFCGRIVDSKKIASQFKTIVDKFQEDAQQAGLLQCETDHVDGSMNALQRNQKIHWLENIKGADKCRILHNVRCLSEGVDVPALDAVLFMSAKKSKTDIIQSVGRVMRKAKNKEYGYIILPIVVPAGESPEKVLDRLESYEVIWDVLRALRSHDSRMDAEINKLDLNNNKSERIQIIGLDEGGYGEDDASVDDLKAHERAPVWTQLLNMKKLG